MLKMNFLILLVLFASSLNCQTGKDKVNTTGPTVIIPLEGNAWVINNIDKNAVMIGVGGLKNWNDENLVIRIYFKITNPGKFNLSIKSKAVGKPADLKILVEGNSEKIEIKNESWQVIPVGKFEIKNPGYHYIEINGIKKSGENLPEIEEILIEGTPLTNEMYYVKEDFYWGRRGPSVHLNYQLPDLAGKIEYFYSEIFVPEGNDILGSYFMANGFGEGYFGIQVNSTNERRILFSVWSPYKTDNPGEIPEEYKIKLLKKGNDVHTGEFGNEGSGGQSYLKYAWKAGVTYGFLLQGKPAGNGSTDYTTWFFDPDQNKWILIAGWQRPKTDSYLTRLHSFLENFYTETGNIQRMAFYKNQWVRTTEGNWFELTKMKFTADATARKQSRMDFSGGAEKELFFLKNCGFFDETTTINSLLERKPTGRVPEIDLKHLP